MESVCVCVCECVRTGRIAEVLIAKKPGPGTPGPVWSDEEEGCLGLSGGGWGGRLGLASSLLSVYIQYYPSLCCLLHLLDLLWFEPASHLCHLFGVWTQ